MPQKYMDPKDAVSAEELALETEAKVEKKEDEVRAAVMTEYGFDEVDDAEKIERLTKERMGAHGKLSTAIGQKVKYREAAKVVKPVVEPKTEPAKTVVAPLDVSKEVAAQLDQRDIDSMELPDTIKENIKRVAQIQGIPAKQAARDPWIVSQIEDHKKAEKTEEAAAGRTNRGGSGGGKKNWSVSSPPDIDVSTADGRKEWDEWLTWAKKEESKG